MNNKGIVLIIMLTVSGYVRSQHTLDIEIINLRNETGLIMLQLFDENHNLVQEEKGIINDERSYITIKNLKPAKYAIRYFHDENMNGILETNKTGKPVEGYGFSNDAYGAFGPKPFKEWLFEINNDKKILLRTKY